LNNKKSEVWWKLNNYFTAKSKATIEQLQISQYLLKLAIYEYCQLTLLNHLVFGFDSPRRTARCKCVLIDRLIDPVTCHVT